jgi:hypothetical protein
MLLEVLGYENTMLRFAHASQKRTAISLTAPCCYAIIKVDGIIENSIAVL